MPTLPSRGGEGADIPSCALSLCLCRDSGGGGGLVRIARVAVAGYTENDFLSGTFFNGLENVDWHTARLFSRQGVSTLEPADL